MKLMKIGRVPKVLL